LSSQGESWSGSLKQIVFKKVKRKWLLLNAVHVGGHLTGFEGLSERRVEAI
jgi:hypothetical protein